MKIKGIVVTGLAWGLTASAFAAPARIKKPAAPKPAVHDITRLISVIGHKATWAKDVKVTVTPVADGKLDLSETDSAGTASCSCPAGSTCQLVSSGNSIMCNGPDCCELTITTKTASSEPAAH